MFFGIGEIVNVVNDLIVAGAAMVAAYVGLQGLDTWKRQIKSNTEYELAKKILTSLYKLREAIRSVRNPFLQYSPEPDLPKEKLEELDKREKDWYAYMQAYQKRWDPVNDAKAELLANIFEAEVVWGSEILEKIKQLNPIINELFAVIQEHIEDKNPNKDYSIDRERRKELRKILYFMSVEEEDIYFNKLKKVISEIEEELKPHIMEYHKKNLT